MTFQITKSFLQTLPFDFAAEVSRYRQARQDHAGTIGEAAPVALHAAVEAAVKRIPPPPDIDPENPNPMPTFVEDYEVIDDTPPEPEKPVLTLAQRKMQMAMEAQRAGAIAQEASCPPLRRRLVTMQGMIAMRTPEAERTPQQQADLKAYEDYQRAFEQIELHLGLIESQIHDLTDETIDAWVMPPFPGAANGAD